MFTTVSPRAQNSNAEKKHKKDVISNEMKYKYPVISIFVLYLSLYFKIYTSMLFS